MSDVRAGAGRPSWTSEVRISVASSADGAFPADWDAVSLISAPLTGSGASGTADASYQVDEGDVKRT
jgi:hypothetical protein